LLQVLNTAAELFPDVPAEYLEGGAAGVQRQSFQEVTERLQAYHVTKYATYN